MYIIFLSFDFVNLMNCRMNEQEPLQKQRDITTARGARISNSVIEGFILTVLISFVYVSFELTVL